MDLEEQRLQREGYVAAFRDTEVIKSIMAGLNFVTGANLWDPTVRFLSDIPSVIDWGEVFSVVVMALTLSLLATLYPAWKAARLDPVQALRMG